VRVPHRVQRVTPERERSRCDGSAGQARKAQRPKQEEVLLETSSPHRARRLVPGWAVPERSPDLNVYAERWLHSVKEEALSRLILFGERALKHALTEDVTHFHQERPHQGKGNVVLLPAADLRQRYTGPIRCHERLGGLLKYYHRKVA
jgi:hypothetical protein